MFSVIFGFTVQRARGVGRFSPFVYSIEDLDESLQAFVYSIEDLDESLQA